MLQRGVQLTTLNDSWVSSMSWYFLNVFGLRSVYSLILGQDNATDHTHKMAEQMSNSVLSGKQDANRIFKAGIIKNKTLERKWWLYTQTDPSMAMTMVKGTLTNVLPMIVLGGWISWVFSGFIITKVLFPLTLRFKGMLQRGVQLTTLNASWKSA
ncbi:uncharacterized protein [Dysidea avara]|uniref:uncharacterized protein isoform X2 n=1 Tax=Dysidea avara TaxID=196820 RepID=UPI00331FD9CA